MAVGKGTCVSHRACRAEAHGRCVNISLVKTCGAHNQLRYPLARTLCQKNLKKKKSGLTIHHVCIRPLKGRSNIEESGVCASQYKICSSTTPILGSFVSLYHKPCNSVRYTSPFSSRRIGNRACGMLGYGTSLKPTLSYHFTRWLPFWCLRPIASRAQSTNSYGHNTIIALLL